jgi:hypothetical protein
MKTWIGIVIVAAALLFASSAATSCAIEAPASGSAELTIIFGTVTA